MIDELSLERYLHKQIPLSSAMQVAVQSATSESVVLAAPLAPNINHKLTAFGGSVSALGILAAWSLLHVRLVEAGQHCEVVIQSNEMDYDRPIEGPFTARSSLVDAAAWPLFLRMLTRKKLARVEVQSSLIYGDATVARFRGRFVAFLRDPG
jgi:thioesterase domain-containing protein